MQMTSLMHGRWNWMEAQSRFEVDFEVDWCVVVSPCQTNNLGVYLGFTSSVSFTKPGSPLTSPGFGWAPLSDCWCVCIHCFIFVLGCTCKIKYWDKKQQSRSTILIIINTLLKCNYGALFALWVWIFIHLTLFLLSLFPLPLFPSSPQVWKLDTNSE